MEAQCGILDRTTAVTAFLRLSNALNHYHTPHFKSKYVALHLFEVKVMRQSKVVLTNMALIPGKSPSIDIHGSVM